jgi:hypothetical protein
MPESTLNHEIEKDIEEPKYKRGIGNDMYFAL